MSRKPFTILVSIPLKPGRAAEFLALLNDVFDAMKVDDTFLNATALRSADSVLLRAGGRLAPRSARRKEP
jgi:hypothetical protein